MSRIRTIKPGFFTSEDMADIDDPWTRLCFIGLWTHADDLGRMTDNPRLVKAALFALDDHITVADVDRMLDSLTTHGVLTAYSVNGRGYLTVTSWKAHQRINRPTPSIYPDPTEQNTTSTRQSVRTHGGLSEDSVRTHGGKGKERNGKEQGIPIAAAQKLSTDLDRYRGPTAQEDVWTALAHELGTVNTDTERTNRGRTRKELDQANATPADVHTRCEEYHRRYPDAPLTDAALRKHWSSLATPTPTATHGRLTPGSQAIINIARRLDNQ